MEKLLEILSNTDCVYSHKIGMKHCGDSLCFHLNDAVFQGFASKEVKDPSHLYKGIRITDAGRIELARLRAIVVPPPPLSAKQIRINELKAKLIDATILQSEIVEFLKLTNT